METDELKRGNAAIQNSSSLVFESDACMDEPHEFTLSYTANGPGAFVLQVQYKVGEDWIQMFHENQPNGSPVVFEHTFTEPGTYPIRYQTRSGGFTEVGSVVVEDCNECENELTADLVCEDENGNKVLTITFFAEEAGPIVIQGGLSAGTIILSAVSNLEELKMVSHQSAGGPSNVTRWEGDVEACQEVTITITFSGGDGVDDWSAKRGDDTLGETEEISCI